jgi:hypothetical protein
MRFEYKVTVEVERSEGKFASRDELGEQIREALESADPGQLDGENGGVYETNEWTVEDA